MPVGLKNAPEALQTVVDVMVASVKWHFAIVYLDDIVNFSEMLENDFDHVSCRHYCNVQRLHLN